jgi:hypothetical protein
MQRATCKMPSTIPGPWYNPEMRGASAHHKHTINSCGYVGVRLSLQDSMPGTLPYLPYKCLLYIPMTLCACLFCSLA